jgi:hypothetical protein
MVGVRARLALQDEDPACIMGNFTQLPTHAFLPRFEANCAKRRVR